jgi:hypothetical protein
MGANSSRTLPTFSAEDGIAVTPSDVTVLRATQGLYVGGAGSVVVVTMGGTTLTFAAVPVGTFMPIRVTQVLAATGASNIVALY